MAATLGQVVLVKHGDRLAPGIVTAVPADDQVNLAVFIDGSTAPAVFSSVEYFESLDALNDEDRKDDEGKPIGPTAIGACPLPA